MGAPSFPKPPQFFPVRGVPAMRWTQQRVQLLARQSQQHQERVDRANGPTRGPQEQGKLKEIVAEGLLKQVFCFTQRLAPAWAELDGKLKQWLLRPDNSQCLASEFWPG